MTMNWKSVGWMSGVLLAMALIVCGTSPVAWRGRQTRLRRELGPIVLLPLVTGFGSADGMVVDPRLHCIPLPTGIKLLSQPISKEEMDRRFQGYLDWSVISERMKPGDNIYPYNNIVHRPLGETAFWGQGGGFVVLRGWCLVGKLHSWVE